MLQPSNSSFYLARNVFVIPAFAAAPRIRDADEASAAPRSVRRLSSFHNDFPAVERPAVDAPHQACASVKRTFDCGASVTGLGTLFAQLTGVDDPVPAEPAPFLVCLNA
jgi:hypothetical protein